MEKYFDIPLQWSKWLWVAVFVAFLCPVMPAQAGENMVVGVEDCVEVALAHNHNLSAQRFEFLSKQAVAQSTQGLAGPRIDFTGGYQWQNEQTALIPAHGMTIPGIYGEHMWQGSINVRQVLYDGGKTKSVIHYNEENMHWQDTELQNQRVSIVNNVVKSFYRALQLQATNQAQKDTIDALRALTKDMQLKLDIGRIAEVDLLQVEAQLAAEEDKRIRYQNDYNKQLATLKNAMGISQDTAITITGNLTEYPIAQVKGEIPQNLDVQKAAIKTQQAKELLSSAKADRAMQVALQGQYNIKDLSSSQDKMWTVMLQANFPLFDGGVLDGNSRQAKLQVEKAKEIYAQTVADTQAAQMNAIDSLMAAAPRVQSAQKALERATEAHRIVTLSYQSGKESITDLLFAQAAMTNAQAAYYQALQDQISAAVDLETVYGQQANKIK